jgi:hypothetical protein
VDITGHNAWANFTIPADRSDIQFARLYVLVYMGNMTANYKGNESIILYNNNDPTQYLAGDDSGNQPLDLEYYREVGTTTATTYIPSDRTHFITLNRVTSDYLNVFDLTGYISGGQNVNVSIQTWNESLNLQPGFGKFDGRIKEAKLVYGWNTTTNPQDTEYWVNEGHDTITKDLVSPYTLNKTSFGNVNYASPYTAKLWVDYSGYTPSAKGKYTWNDATLPTTAGSGYTYTFVTGASNAYGGLHSWEWTNASTALNLNTNNVLTYTNTSTYYKIPLAVLAVHH